MAILVNFDRPDWKSDYYISPRARLMNERCTHLIGLNRINFRKKSKQAWRHVFCVFVHTHLMILLTFAASIIEPWDKRTINIWLPSQPTSHVAHGNYICCWWNQATTIILISHLLLLTLLYGLTHIYFFHNWEAMDCTCH